MRRGDPTMRLDIDTQSPGGNHGNHDGLDWDDMIAELQEADNTKADGTEHSATPTVSHQHARDFPKGPATDSRHDASPASGMQVERHTNNVPEILKGLDIKGIVESAVSKGSPGAVTVVVAPIIFGSDSAPRLGDEHSMDYLAHQRGALSSEGVRIGNLEVATAQHRDVIDRIVGLIARNTLQPQQPSEQIEGRR